MLELQAEVDGVLAGRRILVVEDEFILAEEMAETLRGVGADVIGSAHTVRSALDLIQALPRIDAAVIDVNLAGEMAFPVVDALIEIDRPFIFSTVWRPSQIPLKYRTAPHCAKPTPPAVLLRSLQLALDEHQSFSPKEDRRQSGRDACSFEAADDQTADQLRAIAISQDIEAFKGLFETLAPKVKQYFLSRGVAAKVADGLVQEVMLTAWTKAEQFDPSRCSGQAWLFKIARNLTLDWVSGSQRAGRAMSISVACPEEGAVEGLSRARLAEAVKQLPNEEADLLKLSFFGPSSPARPTLWSGSSSGAVKPRVRSIISRLKTTLDRSLEQ